MVYRCFLSFGGYHLTNFCFLDFLSFGISDFSDFRIFGFSDFRIFGFRISDFGFRDFRISGFSDWSEYLNIVLPNTTIWCVSLSFFLAVGEWNSPPRIFFKRGCMMWKTPYFLWFLVRNCKNSPIWHGGILARGLSCRLLPLTPPPLRPPPPMIRTHWLLGTSAMSQTSVSYG